MADAPAGVLELENGIFNLMIALIQTYESQGFSQAAAKERVAQLFDRYASVLRAETTNEEKGT